MMDKNFPMIFDNFDPPVPLKGQTISECIYEFMKSSFLPKYDRKIFRISAR